jgi:hypothetical protein
LRTPSREGVLLAVRRAFPFRHVARGTVLEQERQKHKFFEIKTDKYQFLKLQETFFLILKSH